MLSAPDIAKRIKELAEKKGIALQAMLKECGLSKNALSSLYAGSFPKVDNLERIASALGCSVDYLLGRVSMDGDIFDKKVSNALVVGVDSPSEAPGYDAEKAQRLAAEKKDVDADMTVALEMEVRRAYTQEADRVLCEISLVPLGDKALLFAGAVEALEVCSRYRRLENREREIVKEALRAAEAVGNKKERHA